MHGVETQPQTQAIRTADTHEIVAGVLLYLDNPVKGTTTAMPVRALWKPMMSAQDEPYNALHRLAGHYVFPSVYRAAREDISDTLHRALMKIGIDTLVMDHELLHSGCVRKGEERTPISFWTVPILELPEMVLPSTAEYESVRPWNIRELDAKLQDPGYAAQVDGKVRDVLGYYPNRRIEDSTEHPLEAHKALGKLVHKMACKGY